MKNTPTMQHPMFKQCLALGYRVRNAKNKKPVAHLMIEKLKQVMNEAPPRSFDNQ